MGLLDTLIFGYRQVVDGAGALVLQRNKIKFVGAGSVVDDVANAQTVVTLTGNSSLGTDGNGNSVITGPISDTSNPKMPTQEYIANRINTAATAQTAITIPTTSNRLYTVRGSIGCVNTAANAYGDWDVKFNIRNAAGVVTIPTATPVTQNENTSSFVVAASVSGTSVLIQVTDPAAPGLQRRFTGTLWVAEHQL